MSLTGSQLMSDGIFLNLSLEETSDVIYILPEGRPPRNSAPDRCGPKAL